MKESKLFRSLLFGSLVAVFFSGCTAGMLGDQGSHLTTVNLVAEAKPAISPDSVKVDDIAPDNVSAISQQAIDAYVEKHLKGAEKIADIQAAGSGYGDKKGKAIERAKKRAASIGANVILIVGNQKSSSVFDNIYGSGYTTLKVLAYYQK